jgi:hypothetical protein
VSGYSLGIQSGLANSPPQFVCQPGTHGKSIGRSQIAKRDNVEALSLRRNQFSEEKKKKRKKKHKFIFFGKS